MKRLLYSLVCVLFLIPALSAAGDQESDSALKSPTVMQVEIFDRGNTPGDFLTNGPPAQFVQKAFGDPNNIRVEWVPVPRNQEVDKLNVMMAAENAPDLVFTYSENVWKEFARQGGLVDLGPYIEKHGSDLRKWLGEEVLSWGRYQEKQYTIPGRRTIRGILGTWIRKDWLDTLGLPLPETREEYLAALRAFRDQDPGNVGENLAPMGFGPIKQVQFWLNLFYSFQFDDGLPTERERAARIGWNDLTLPGSKEALHYLNILQNEGLLQRDWAIAPDQKEFESALASGYVGTFSGNRLYPWFYNIMPAIKENDPEAYWVPIDPFRNSVGQTPKLYWTPIGIYNFTPVFSDIAENVVKYLNWMSINENLVHLMYGEEGVHYDRNPDGIIIPRDLSRDQVWEHNLLDRSMVINGTPYEDQETVYKASVLQYVDEKYSMDLFIRHDEYLATDGVVDAYIENLPKSYIEKRPILDDKIQEIMTRAILAAPEDFDRIYEAGYKELLDLGIMEVKEDLLAAYDAQQQ